MRLTSEQTNASRGIAILLIALHNFLRHPLEISGNEMIYDTENTHVFLEQLSIGHWWYVVPAFIGWCGVPVFLFLSAYGLTKKYGNEPINGKDFMKSHAIKLWKMMFAGMIVFWIVQLLTCTPTLHRIIQSLGTLTLVSNVVQSTYPGAYWFFGLIFQFYLLFLYFRNCSTKKLWILLLISLPLAFISLNTPVILARRLRQNFIGWMAPFILGLIFARDEHEYSHRQVALWVLGLIPITAASFIYQSLAPITDIAVPLLVIGLTILIPMPNLTTVGRVSSIIFILHPAVRELLYNVYDCDIFIGWTTLLYLDIIAIITPIWYLTPIYAKRLYNFYCKK